MKNFLVVVLVLGFVNSCTWVKLDSEAEKIRVVYQGELTSCRDIGAVTVSVKHDIAGVERNALKVRDELETMARNEAVTMHGDTIKPLGEPAHGEQRFGVYVCR